MFSSCLKNKMYIARIIHFLIIQPRRLPFHWHRVLEYLFHTFRWIHLHGPLTNWEMVNTSESSELYYKSKAKIEYASDIPHRPGCWNHDHIERAYRLETMFNLPFLSSMRLE